MDRNCLATVEVLPESSKIPIGFVFNFDTDVSIITIKQAFVMQTNIVILFQNRGWYYLNLERIYYPTKAFDAEFHL